MVPKQYRHNLRHQFLQPRKAQYRNRKHNDNDGLNKQYQAGGHGLFTSKMHRVL